MYKQKYNRKKDDMSDILERLITLIPYFTLISIIWLYFNDPVKVWQWIIHIFIIIIGIMSVILLVYKIKSYLKKN